MKRSVTSAALAAAFIAGAGWTATAEAYRCEAKPQADFFGPNFGPRRYTYTNGDWRLCVADGMVYTDTTNQCRMLKEYLRRVDDPDQRGWSEDMRQVHRGWAKWYSVWLPKYRAGTGKSRLTGWRLRDFYCDPKNHEPQKTTQPSASRSRSSGTTRNAEGMYERGLELAVERNRPGAQWWLMGAAERGHEGAMRELLGLGRTKLFSSDWKVTMDIVTRNRAARAVRRVLDRAAVRKGEARTTWSNQSASASGTVVALGTGTGTAEGIRCRSFTHTIRVGERTESKEETACREGTKPWTL